MGMQEKLAQKSKRFLKLAIKKHRVSPRGFKELDRVLGGGIVPGSAILIGGHPGAGKSTLLLQVMCGLAKNMTALYVTGEESLNKSPCELIA